MRTEWCAACDTDRGRHYLLASGGIDAAQLANTIQNTDIANTFEPLQPVYDTDVEGFIRHEHEQVILNMIEESRRETLDDFQQGLHEQLHQDWEAQKQRILEELGQYRVDEEEGEAARALRCSVSTAAPPAALARPSVPPASATGADTSASMSQLHSRMVRYDTVITRLNRARAEGQPFPLVREFMDTVASLVQEPARKRSVLDSWKVLLHLVHEAERAAAPPERAYAAAYVPLDAFHTADGAALRRGWVRGSRAFLEAQFAEYMEQVIATSPVQAQRGGVPTVRATVAAFLRAQLRNANGAWSPELAPAMDVGSQTPLWAHLFFLVRIGEAREALACMQENEAVLQRTDSAFLACFKVWAEGEEALLPRGLWEHLMAEYMARFHNAPLQTLDPYQYALYRLVGRFDVAKKFPPALVANTENWLWLQLRLVREAPENEVLDAAQQRYTLQDLGNKLEKYGEAHFDPRGTRPLHYFQLLLLVGRFERALGYLQAHASFQVDVVHFATALAYYGLLRVPPAAAASQFDYVTAASDAATGTAVVYFDYAKLIQRYTRLFLQASRRDAVQYISLICLSADSPAPVGEEQVQRCHELVRNLILEAPSSGFAELLGDMRVDGLKTPGVIEQSLPLLRLDTKRDFLSKIVRSAAVQCEREQRTASAILLYNIVGERETVMAVLNRELGATLMDPAPLEDWDAPAGAQGATVSVVANVVSLARAILGSYESQFGYTGPKCDVCRTLLGLKRAVSLNAAGQHSQALHMLEELRILPLDPESRRDVVSITRKAEEFKSYDENITKNFAEIALMAMTILYTLHQELKNSVHRTGSEVRAPAPHVVLTPQALFEYRSQARALMMWAGMLRFRMSNETYSQLTRLDVYVRGAGRVQRY